MSLVFGPVPSRRLGQSLGIDTIPMKTCNWNCIYCQLGRTSPLINERKRHIPRMQILAEMSTALSELEVGETDWATFVGSGEPTLHADLGWLIRQAKALTDIPVAVITNGSLLHLPSLQEELAVADAVLPRLDAGNENLFRRINRPHPKVTFERLLTGLREFRRGYDGKLWVEVMLVAELNDSAEALQDIAAALHEIQPDEVHLNLPTRPPAESWVKPANHLGVRRAMATLGKIARVVHPGEGRFDLSMYTEVVDALVAIITRHPMRHEELVQTLSERPQDQAMEILEQLILSGRVRTIERHGIRHWTASECHFVDKSSPLL